MSETKLIEPKLDIDALMARVATKSVIKLLNGTEQTLFYDKDNTVIAMGVGTGPHYLQFFAFGYIYEMAEYKTAKDAAEAEEIRLREENAAKKLAEREAAQAAKDARRLEMRALHGKTD